MLPRRISGSEYAAYLESRQWQMMREMALERFEWRCAVCYSEGPLEVHHRTYERLGNEEFGDLIVLCDVCHRRHHAALAAFTDFER